jgi:glycoside/pentoside/hexuronide:cation symporter, GPH family
MSESNNLGEQVTDELSTGKLTFKQKIIYASGQLPGSFFTSFTGQIQAFYYAWMGLNIKYIIISQVLYAIWNAVNDPLFGVLQDNTRSKDGRYIPWIKYIAPIFTVAFIILFFPPQQWRYGTGGEEYQIYLAAWYLISQMFYDTGFTIVFIAHVALAPQMTMDQKERTDISVLSAIMSIAGIGISAAFPLLFLTNPTASSIIGLQITVVVFGILGFIPWIFIVKKIKENPEFIPKKADKMEFWKNIKYVFKNPSGRIYVLYDGISVGLLNTVMTAITFIIAWVFVVNPEYNPGWETINIIPYLVPVVLCFIIGLFIELNIPNKWGKDVKYALMYSMIMEAIGFFIAFLGVITSTNLTPDALVVPNNLWVVSLGMSIAMLGFSGDFIYHNVMRADTIDWDEVETGERRESVYAGIGCLLSKPMISVALIIVPALMSFYGLVPKSPDDPTDAALVVEQGFDKATIAVAIAGFLVPAIFALIGCIFWVYYPLDKKALTELRIKLAVLHKKKRAERLNADGTSKFLE